MLAGVREILLIFTPQDTPRFEQRLGDGARWGLRIDYAVQPAPEGLAQAMIIGESFLNGAPSVLVLGDNIFYGRDLEKDLASASTRHEGATVLPARSATRSATVLSNSIRRATQSALKRSPASPNPVSPSPAFTSMTAMHRKSQDLSDLRPAESWKLPISTTATLHWASCMSRCSAVDTPGSMPAPRMP